MLANHPVGLFSGSNSCAYVANIPRAKIRVVFPSFLVPTVSKHGGRIMDASVVPIIVASQALTLTWLIVGGLLVELLVLIVFLVHVAW